MTSAPLWLVHVVGRHPLTVQATTSTLAVAQAERRGYTVVYYANGLPAVSYAGYAADENCPRPMPRGMVARKRRRDLAALADSPSARLAVELREEIRSGIMRTTGSERLVSDSRLRDFAAEVGLAADRLDEDGSLTETLAGEDAHRLHAALAALLVLCDQGLELGDVRERLERCRHVTIPQLHRRTMDGEPEVSARQLASSPARCEVCGRHLPADRVARGERQRYCGDRCKVAARRARRLASL